MNLSEIDLLANYRVNIILKYSIDGRTRESLIIEKIEGYSLHKLLCYLIPPDEIAELFCTKITM